jgi:glycosyltransferase involved in cell wall biosynthesis
MFEAMGMGLPIMLAAPEGEASRLLAEDAAGLWVPAGDPAALAAACRRLSVDRALRESLAANSLKAAPRHTREQQASLFIDEWHRPGQLGGYRVTRLTRQYRQSGCYI